jgi:hypothetical protein
LGLPDYLVIVKQPMDLGTVKGRMESLQYESLDGVAEDLRLVWRNCMLYNRDGSEVLSVCLLSVCCLSVCLRWVSMGAVANTLHAT